MDDKTIKINVFNNKLKAIMCDENETVQTNFLKIYPIFKPDNKLIDKWNDIYLELFNNHQENQRINAIKFLIIGLTNNYLEYETKDIFKLLELLEKNGEDPSCLNTLKYNF